MSESWNGKDEIVEQSILSGRETSRCFLEANEDYLSERYPGKEVVAVTAESEPEIAGVYDRDSGNWRRILEQVRDVYGEKAYYTAVARGME